MRMVIRVSWMHVRALAEVVQARGVSQAGLLRQAGIEDDRLQAARGWFSLEEFDRLMVEAVALTGDAALGLHWGQEAPITQYDLLPILVAQTPSLSAAIQAVLRFQPILSDQPEIEFSNDRGHALLRCHPLARSTLGLRVRSEVLVTALVRLVRDVGRAAQPAIERVSLRHARPPYAAAYDELFDGLVHFDQPEVSVAFRATDLDRLQQHSDHELLRLLELQAERVLARVVDEQPFSEQVRAALQRTLPRVPEMQELAKACGMSERSLRRKLAEEGSSYKHLVEQTQIALAQTMLEHKTKSIKEIAYELGFASASGFHRAFKRCTGESPASFRARGN